MKLSIEASLLYVTILNFPDILLAWKYQFIYFSKIKFPFSKKGLLPFPKNEIM